MFTISLHSQAGLPFFPDREENFYHIIGDALDRLTADNLTRVAEANSRLSKAVGVTGVLGIVYRWDIHNGNIIYRGPVFRLLTD